MLPQHFQGCLNMQNIPCSEAFEEVKDIRRNKGYDVQRKEQLYSNGKYVAFLSFHITYICHLGCKGVTCDSCVSGQ